MSNAKTSSLAPATVHQMIRTAFDTQKNAHVPYSNFRVGAALLAENGTIVGGCNIENASYGAGICAERTAIPKALSDGHKSFRAIVVTSQLPTPTCSPCGICRQVIREFFPLNSPIIMVGSKYDATTDSPPAILSAALAASGVLAKDAEGAQGGEGWEEFIKIMTLEELLPMSFGPEHLDMPR